MGFWNFYDGMIDAEKFQKFMIAEGYCSSYVIILLWHGFLDFSALKVQKDPNNQEWG
jgi:hypothetical protein